MRAAVDPVPQFGEFLEVAVESAPTRAEQRHADAVVGDRCHVRLGAGRPVHLDVVRPRLGLHMPADAPAARPRAGLFETQRPADRGVQSVGRGEVAGLPASGAHAVGVLTYFTDFVSDDLDTGFDGGIDQRAVQHCPSHAAPGASFEFRVDVPVAVPIADSADRFAVRMHRKRAADDAGYAASALRRMPCRSGRCAVRRPRRPARRGRRGSPWPDRPGHRRPPEDRSCQARQRRVLDS